jgi:hypothetical protein
MRAYTHAHTHTCSPAKLIPQLHPDKSSTAAAAAAAASCYQLLPAAVGRHIGPSKTQKALQARKEKTKKQTVQPEDTLQ